LAVLAVASLASTAAVAQNAPAAEATKPTVPAATADVNAAKPAPAKTVITIILAREIRDRPTPLSLLDIPPADDGIAGAKLGIGDNNTTGRFLNQEYVLDVVENAKPAQLVSDVVAKLGERGGFIIADAAPETILTLADAAAAKGGIVVAIARELKIPVKFIGLGEQVDDLQPFDPKSFAEALFAQT
jgi:hypothetical protein